MRCIPEPEQEYLEMREREPCLDVGRQSPEAYADGRSSLGRPDESQMYVDRERYDELPSGEDDTQMSYPSSGERTQMISTPV
jgi:hypothetical protein